MNLLPPWYTTRHLCVYRLDSGDFCPCIPYLHGYWAMLSYLPCCPFLPCCLYTTFSFYHLYSSTIPLPCHTVWPLPPPDTILLYSHVTFCHLCHAYLITYYACEGPYPPVISVFSFPSHLCAFPPPLPACVLLLGLHSQPTIS